MAITTYNGFISAIGSGKYAIYPYWTEIVGVPVSFGQGAGMIYTRGGHTRVLPSLPPGITKYIVASVFGANSASVGSMLFGKLINFGSIDIGSNVFTDGVAMPSMTELGVSNTTASPIFIEVTTALNSTPGNLTVTYVDQDGNTSETTASQALPISSPIGSGGLIILNSTDWGARDVTTASRTGGTTPSGVIKFWGMIPICFANNNSNEGYLDDMIGTFGFNPIRFDAGDEIGAFNISGSNATRSHMGVMLIIGE